jgi:hypothetical protein
MGGCESNLLLPGNGVASGWRCPRRSSRATTAATNQDLEPLVERGSFREDLHYRVRVVELVIHVILTLFPRTRQNLESVMSLSGSP